MECLSPYLCMVTVPHRMVGLERMLDYRGVGLARFHCSRGISVVKGTLASTWFLVGSTVICNFSGSKQGRMLSR